MSGAREHEAACAWFREYLDGPPDGTELTVPISSTVTKRAEREAQADLVGRLRYVCGGGVKSVYVWGHDPDSNVTPRLVLVVDDLFSSDANAFRTTTEAALAKAVADATAEADEELQMMKPWLKALLGRG